MLLRESKLFATATKFAVSGVVNTAFGYGIIYGLMYFGVGPYASNLMGYFAGFVLAFVLHHSWVFRSQLSLSNVGPKYILSVSVAYIVNISVLAIFVETGMSAWFGQIVSGGVYTVFLYLLSKFWVFRREEG